MSIAEHVPHTTTTWLQPVVFSYDAPDASQVFLTGSFNSWLNDWDADDYRISYAGNGIWRLEIGLPPGRYEYLFVVDGHWGPDPAATDYIPNPFGGMNSVMTVPEFSDHETAPLSGETEC